MRIATKNLKPGTIMQSGEVVIKANRSGKSYMSDGVKMDVVLKNPKTQKSRLAQYAYCGSLSVKSVPMGEEHDRS